MDALSRIPRTTARYSLCHQWMSKYEQHIKTCVWSRVNLTSPDCSMPLFSPLEHDQDEKETIKCFTQVINQSDSLAIVQNDCLHFQQIGLAYEEKSSHLPKNWLNSHDCQICGVNKDVIKVKLCWQFESVVLNLYKRAEPLRSFPSLCQTAVLPNITESKNGLLKSDNLLRAPETAPSNPRVTIEAG